MYFNGMGMTATILQYFCFLRLFLAKSKQPNSHIFGRKRSFCPEPKPFYDVVELSQKS